MLNKKFRWLATLMAALSMGLNIGFAARIGSSLTGTYSYPSVGDIWTETGNGSSQGNPNGRSEIPEVILTDINGAGSVNYPGPAALIPGTDNTNPLGVTTYRWSDLEAVTSTFWGTVTFRGNFSQSAVAGVAPSTTTSLGQGLTAYLGGTVNAAVGSALCALSPVAGQGISVQVCPATTGLPAIGISSVVTSTGSIVSFYTAGFNQALTTGTVTTGDLEVTSSLSAGYLQSNDTFSVSTYTVVGIALNSGNSAGGLTQILQK